MKKLLLISFLTLGFYTVQLHAMEEREQSTLEVREEETKEQDSLIYYTIVCKDEKLLKISKLELALFKKYSITIKDLFENVTQDETNEITVDVNYSIVKEILKMIDLIDSSIQPINSEESEIFNTFIDKPLPNLIELLNATHYFNIPQLLKALMKVIASKIVKETKPEQWSFKCIIPLLNNRSIQPIITWFQNNKDELHKLPKELATCIALEIMNQYPTSTLYVPIKSLTTERSETFAWHPHDPSIFAFRSKNIIALWNLNDDCVTPLRSTALVSSIAWNGNGTKIAISSENENRIWGKNTNENKWQQVSSLSRPFIECISIAWNKDDTKIAGLSVAGTIVIWKKKDGNEWKAIARIDTGIFGNYGNYVKWSDDDADAFLTISNVTQKWIKKSGDDDNRKTSNDDWSKTILDRPLFLKNPRNGLLAVATYQTNSPAIILQHPSSLICTLLHGHTAPIHKVAWNADGTILASWSCDTAIHLWEQKLIHPSLTIGKALLSLAWCYCNIEKTHFEIPEELRNDYEAFPEELKAFLTTKNCCISFHKG